MELRGSAGAPSPTGVSELDRVLSGGLVPGSVTLLGGEPGMGKSTLVLQALGCLARAGRRALLVSAEESAEQVRTRAERLGALHPQLWILAETSMPRILAAVEQVRPEVVAVDSVQTVFDPELNSAPGSVAQVKGCSQWVVGLSKSAGVPSILVGQVTKEGSLAGPMLLEHLVDTVLSFEGDRYHSLRLLRATKHRFGPTGELGLFELGEDGLRQVEDPGGLLLGDRRPGVPGATVVPALEGKRTLLVEVQALVGTSDTPSPRRSAQGTDPGRLALLLAVLERRAGLSLARRDVFASVVGGVKVTEPAADLAIVLSLVSAVSERPLDAELVACGEIGLGGEVRQVAHARRRLAEASRLGFRRAVVPAAGPEGPPGMEVTRVGTLSEALEVAF